MRILLTLCAPFCYQAGVNRCELDFAQESLTAGEFLVELSQRWPRLSQLRVGCLAQDSRRGLTLIVNGEISDTAFPLKDGDRVSILGPLSGG